MIRLVFILILFSVALKTVSGQDSLKQVKILPVPAFGFSPETKTYVGAVTLFTFDLYNDTITRTSNAKFEFNYTWNKQMIFEIDWNYFFREEKWFTKGRINYSDYPDFYYGVGSESPDAAKLLFNSNRMVIEASVLKKLERTFFVGINTKFLNYYHVDFAGNNSFPELTDHSVVGIGLTLLGDSRNNLLTPTKGFFSHIAAGYNFAKQNYGEATADFRYYKTWQSKFTWANRLINEFTFGTPPFFDYAFLGGDKYVRGYNYGRYRDKNLTSLQTEFRLPLFWKIGLATFGGLSNLYGSKNFNLNQSKFNAGLGLRVLVDKHDNTNLRLDYAIGNNGNSGFYVSFGESF